MVVRDGDSPRADEIRYDLACNRGLLTVTRQRPPVDVQVISAVQQPVFVRQERTLRRPTRTHAPRRP